MRATELAMRFQCAKPEDLAEFFNTLAPIGKARIGMARAFQSNNSRLMTTSDQDFIVRIKAALSECRASITSAFHEALYFSWDEGESEVRGLIQFFLELPSLQAGLDEVLTKSKVSAEIKGVFCHKAGASGPVVEFDIPTTGPGCELSDLLILVTYSEAVGTLTLGNACFLQAKVDRPGLLSGTRSTKRQRELYERAPTFRFRNAPKYSHSSFVDGTDGNRMMPGASSSGFCYWTFSDGRPNRSRKLNSSAIIVPANVTALGDDLPFGAAMFDLMRGDFGLRVEKAEAVDFGWSRTVHDVILSAMKEALSCSAGIIGVSDARRITPHFMAHADRGGDLALVSNPFDELAAAFDSGGLKDYAAAMRETPRVSPDDLMAKIRQHEKRGGQGVPPERTDRDRGLEGEGGGSFIHINFRAQETRRRRTRQGTD